jgi:hypothetical protein
MLMVVNRHVGIVLRIHSPRKQMVTILDKEDGAVTYVPDALLCSGAFLHYIVIKKNNLLLLHASEQINLPLNLAKHDILFLHHVLELCYYFLPIGSPAPEVFEHLQQLYTCEHIALSRVIKKLFLVRLFLLFGVYPEDTRLHASLLQYGARSLVDMTTQEFVNLENENMVDAWLHSCIAVHPRSSLFKTVHFLTEK